MQLQDNLIIQFHDGSQIRLYKRQKLPCVFTCCAAEKRQLGNQSSFPVIVAKFVIPVLLCYIVTLIVEANWENGPGDT